MQGERFLFNLVFDAAFKDVFAFEGIGSDHLPARGALFQFQQDDVRSLGGDGAGEDPPVGEPFDGFFRKKLFLSFTDDEDMIVAGAVMHVLEKGLQVLFKGVDDIE